LSAAPFEFGLWLSALPLLLGAASVTWLLSLPLRNAGIVEPLWSLMLFAAGVVYALGSDPRAPRLSVVLWLCAIWAARTAWVRARAHGGGEAPVYADLRARHAPHFALKSLLLVFVSRALGAWVVSLPLMGAFAGIRPWRWLDALALALVAGGFLAVVMAEWRQRRLPALAGECCLWWGFYAFSLSAGAWWAVPGPLLMTALLLRPSWAAIHGRIMPTRS
jgi:steroid 5-alpha reductase family enzyme